MQDHARQPQHYKTEFKIKQSVMVEAYGIIFASKAMLVSIEISLMTKVIIN